MNNKAFESLDITCVNESAVPGVGHFDSLVYALEQFNGLKELTMFKMIDDIIEGADKVIQALSSHTGLRKLHLESVDIGIKGYTNLAAMLLSSSCSLSTLNIGSKRSIQH